MSAIKTSPAPTAPNMGRLVASPKPLTRRCRFSLTTRADSDVVVRVLMLLRRRGCRVVAVNFRRADRHGPGNFELSVDAPTRVGHRLEEWLRGLVDVVAVREAERPR
jgi:acetolactate synthase regulatory subunit